MKNPFVVSLIAEGERFADREPELARIEEAFRTPGGKLVVYGDRRLGKSSAIETAAAAVRAAGDRVAVASFATASDAAEAAQRVLAAAQKQIGTSWREVLEGIGRSIRAGIDISPAMDPGGMPGLRLSFGLDPKIDPNLLLPDVLTALDAELGRRRLTLGIALDEFQRIHDWGGEDAEWALRDAIQRHANIAYVLAGSKRHLIEAMVGNKSRALWKMAEVLHLGPIDPVVLADWITEQAAITGIDLPRTESDAIVRLAGPRTRDIVQLARTVWAFSRDLGRVEPDSTGAALETIVEEQAELYRAIFVKLNARQQGVLRAFAAETRVRITSAEAIRRYRLGPKSTVQSTVESLVEDEHLTRSEPGVYGFDDPFFRRWVQTYALPDIGEPTPRLMPRPSDSTKDETRLPKGDP